MFMIPVLIGVVVLGYMNPIVRTVKNTTYKIKMHRYNKKAKHVRVQGERVG